MAVVITAGTVGAMDVDTAIGADMAMVVQATEIARAGPIGAARLVGMPVVGSAVTRAVDSTVAVAFMAAVAADSTVVAEVDSMAVGAGSMEVAATEGGTTRA